MDQLLHRSLTARLNLRPVGIPLKIHPVLVMVHHLLNRQLTTRVVMEMLLLMLQRQALLLRVALLALVRNIRPLGNSLLILLRHNLLTQILLRNQAALRRPCPRRRRRSHRIRRIRKAMLLLAGHIRRTLTNKATRQHSTHPPHTHMRVPRLLVLHRPVHRSLTLVMASSHQHSSRISNNFKICMRLQYACMI